MTDAVRPKISVGYRVGKLTVEASTSERKGGYVVWRCRCDCGGEIELDTRCLQRGSVHDCGCSTKARPGMDDLTGQRFGKLTCIEPTDERDSSGGAVWRCRCDCGTECLAPARQLKAGGKKSCGCLVHRSQSDLTGQHFGLLEVVSLEGESGGHRMWRCRCECGGEAVVRQANLLSGRTRSCGCLRAAQGVKNLKIADGTSVAMIEARMARSPISSNTGGHNGVYRRARDGRWVAQITFKGRTHYLGLYDELEDAVNARQRGEELYGEFLERYYNEHPEEAPADASAATNARASACCAG